LVGFRNWNLNITVPPDHMPSFMNACICGINNLQVKTPFKNVIFCAQPKSASLYIIELLARSLNFTNHQIGFNLSGGSVYFPRLLAAKFVNGNTISHCHESANPNMIDFIKKLDLIPIVLYRNLLDTLVSRRDMLIKDKWAPNMCSQKAIASFLAATEECQFDMIINLFAVEFINFYTSWVAAAAEGTVRPLFISYEEMMENKQLFVRRVADFLGEAYDERLVEKAVEDIDRQGGINFNKGIHGRGRLLLNARQKKRLLSFAAQYGCNDKAYLGVDVDR
jgi:hypothetical protein